MENVELMAPAGSREALAAAIRAGADAVYFGVDQLNMRSRAAHPFSLSDLKEIARICRWCRVKSYLALNVILFDDELALMKQTCDAALKAGISAVIASDISAILYARSIGLEVHISVQANICNIEAVRFYAQYADVMVLARELTVEQIRAVSDAVREQDVRGPSDALVRLECFVHGAMCVAHSGKCWMSLAQYNSSANRGACYQTCRRKYRVIEEETGQELVIDNQYVMSPGDLCMVEHLEELLEAGVSVLKIEGRGRVADYVSTVVGVYKEALEALRQGSRSPAQKASWKARLESVFNRGFWEGGYYMGRELGAWSASDSSQAAVRRVQVSTVDNFYSQLGVVRFRMLKDGFRRGDELLVEGPTTGAVRFAAEEIRVDGRPAARAVKGDEVTLCVPVKVRRNDKVFVHEPVVGDEDADQA